VSGKPDERDRIAARQVRELLKNLDHWEKQDHTTVTIAYLRRHFGEKK